MLEGRERFFFPFFSSLFPKPRGDTRYGRERPDRKRDRGARRRSGARAGAARAAAAQSRAGPVRVRASGRDVGTLRRSQVSQGPGRESTGKFSSDFLRELRI